MSGAFQAGNRAEVIDAIYKALTANLQGQADAESDRCAEYFGELTGDDYTGDGVKLRIPDIVSVEMKMDEQAIVHPTACPVVYVGGNGTTTLIDAEQQMGRESFADTDFMIAGYVTTRAVYQGVTYRLTERELIAIAGYLGGAIIGALRSGGTDSPWAAQAGIINPRIRTMTVNGYTTGDDQKTSAAKVLLQVQVGHEMRY